jgi:hypothetical protein
VEYVFHHLQDRLDQDHLDHHVMELKAVHIIVTMNVLPNHLAKE